MYFQPYGDEQQLNLNWIINEIINLHKQLDPDYETPSFTQVYPYSNLNRLNLDWILSELKALKELAPEPAPGPAPSFDIQAVAKALVALPFDSNTSYQIYDFISRDGEIWRATEAIAAGGVWDETKWYKTKLGTDLAVLERWINTINNSLTTEIQTRQDADTALQNTIDALTSADISDDSDAGGATVKASLNNLKGSLNAIADDLSDEIDARENAIAAIVSDKTAYTPSFTWYTSTDPTVDNKDFSYSAINDRLLLIYGRFRLVSKNEKNTNTSLGLSIPTKYVIDGTSNANFGVVFGMGEITNLATRLSSSRTSIFFTLGGAGNWSYGAFTEGQYYTVLALVPVKLA